MKKSRAKSTKNKLKKEEVIELKLTGEYSLIGVERLRKHIREVVREELDNPLIISYKDFVETRNASSELIDQVERVKTKNSFVLVPKKRISK
jgi:hypothetical protein